MVDASPSATPMPAQPVAAVTSTEAFTSLPAPLSRVVPPSVTDPVSNLDFPPVDDAFALELRSETIEQLVGGDALRRGESERIEAGRSGENAERIAGRDRVRVHGSLHEHAGHALAEQAAHLDATVDGALDVHAGSEDTVLLAGHMRDLWDGGAAIVAAMTDDTVAGGGIRVTTPLDLWVHGLMGVEERIGTCTADAVLMELGATHYEREYGPGVHAAGLAAYAGSLYQSSRSTFRPLIRVSRGVRNLIDGGDDGRGGEHGGGGSAPAVSPPPVPAQTAPSEAATGTLAAGRRTAQAAALDADGALTDARRVPLEALVDAVDARVGEEMGEAGAVVRAEDLPEHTRSTDTAGQLGALLETLRMDATESASEATGGFRASELEGAVSMHPVSCGNGPLEIDPPLAVYGANAPMVRPHPGVAWGQGPEMQLGLLGGADRPLQSIARESDFLALYHRLRELKGRHVRLFGGGDSNEFKLAIERFIRKTERQIGIFGGDMEELAQCSYGTSRIERAHEALQEMARQAEGDGNRVRAGKIRAALDAIYEQAVQDLETLCRKYGMDAAPSTPAIRLPRLTAGPTATFAVIPRPARTPVRFDWISAYVQARNLSHQFSSTGWHIAYVDFRRAADRISNLVMTRFRNFGGDSNRLLPPSCGVAKPVQAYRAIQDMVRRAAESDHATLANEIRQTLKDINHFTFEVLNERSRKYGAFDALFTQAARTMQATQAMQRPPATAGSSVTVASTTVATPGRLDIPVPAHPTVLEVSPAFPQPAGGLVHATDVPGPPRASGLPGSALSEATSAEAGDLGRWKLHHPASATTASHPVAAEATVTPSLGETSSFWLQPVDRAPAPGTVAFDPGVHHAGMAVQPPPVTTTPTRTAPASGAAYPVPSWLDDDFAVERALLAGNLPPGFDASRLILEARTFTEFGLAEDLAAGRLPMQAIDGLIEGFRATDDGGGNALFIEYLRSLKESIERALRDAYPRAIRPGMARPGAWSWRCCAGAVSLPGRAPLRPPACRSSR